MSSQNQDLRKSRDIQTPRRSNRDNINVKSLGPPEPTNIEYHPLKRLGSRAPDKELSNLQKSEDGEDAINSRRGSNVLKK